MSAFIVDPEHIKTLVNWAARREYGASARYYWQGNPHPITGDEQRVGQVLTDANYRSVNYRYDESKAAHAYRHTVRPVYSLVDPVQILKAVNCLDYQSCETPDWKDTEAYAILESIKERAICELPGYDGASWEITTPQTATLVLLK